MTTRPTGNVDDIFFQALVKAEEGLGAANTKDDLNKAADELMFAYMRWSMNHRFNKNTHFLGGEYERLQQLAGQKASEI